MPETAGDIRAGGSDLWFLALPRRVMRSASLRGQFRFLLGVFVSHN